MTRLGGGGAKHRLPIVANFHYNIMYYYRHYCRGQLFHSANQTRSVIRRDDDGRSDKTKTVFRYVLPRFFYYFFVFLIAFYSQDVVIAINRVPARCFSVIDNDRDASYQRCPSSLHKCTLNHCDLSRYSRGSFETFDIL